MNTLKPYDFEPIVSSNSGDEASGTYDEPEVQEDDNSSHSTSRVGNIRWCKCGECRAMSTEVESVCCSESNEIPEDFFEGTYFNHTNKRHL